MLTLEEINPKLSCPNIFGMWSGGRGRILVVATIPTPSVLLRTWEKRGFVERKVFLMFPHVSQAWIVTHASRRRWRWLEGAVKSAPQTQTSSTFRALLHPLVSFSLPVERQMWMCTSSGSQEEAYFRCRRRNRRWRFSWACECSVWVTVIKADNPPSNCSNHPTADAASQPCGPHSLVLFDLSVFSDPLCILLVLLTFPRLRIPRADLQLMHFSRCCYPARSVPRPRSSTSAQRRR